MAKREASPAVEGWLWLGALLIASMVVVGGITRLTGSGLSITDWRPVTGALPPLSEADWETAFANYQASPQFQKVNTHFGVAEFKQIFWWEWFHRFLGRFTGLFFVLPPLLFAIRRRMPPWVFRRAVWLAGMIGFQGLLGWLMVKSGLIDVPRVSHFRLAAHLLTALFTFTFTVWTAVEVRHGRRPLRDPRGLAMVLGLVGLTVLQITWGAFVAGHHAGGIYPTFPKMGPTLIPPGIGGLDPLLRNLVDNPVTVQFVHRWLGAVVLLAFFFVALHLARRPALRSTAVALVSAVTMQFGLGVLTVLYFAGHPVFLGVIHQAGAVGMMAVLTFAAYIVRAAPSAVPSSRAVAVRSAAAG